METHKTHYNVGDVLAYKSHRPELFKTPAFGEVLAIKLEPRGVFYQMSDSPTQYTGQNSTTDFWVSEESVIQKYVRSTK